MMKVLAFDTSSKALSVAILDGEQLLADVTVNVKEKSQYQSHACD